MAKWITCFGCKPWLVTYQGSNFVGSLMSNLPSKARVCHHFETPYCPRTNGTGGRLCREFIRISRALLSEWKLQTAIWPFIIDAIQSVMNQSPVKRLGENKEGIPPCRTEVFTGLKQSALLIRPMQLLKCRELNAVNEARVWEILNIESVHESLEEMNWEVAEGNELRRNVLKGYTMPKRTYLQ